MNRRTIVIVAGLALAMIGNTAWCATTGNWLAIAVMWGLALPGLVLIAIAQWRKP